MAKGRFVLRYRGEGVVPDADVTRVQQLPGAVVVDSSARMLVVEADAGPLRALVDGLPDWVLAPEQAFVVPDVRQKIERPPT
ncbi:MAG TPA: hypothetical protein VL337_15775 [Acidimicrobiales bacterium]|nr:hypothetical protein [Acidimicrobiales bacterium]